VHRVLRRWLRETRAPVVAATGRRPHEPESPSRIGTPTS
jgi:hypothetical protein